ncbi:hypothetical protein ElyMa_006497000 [Elysia marginata]|uniref:Nudix hydrolase domain-containing protein n=1 Tax=Elysia marginata TaxID=1093978 RepID=A0AAV4I2W5_9GAST|nr:hypothetical protein ElyMa_006497000 [Elysia marginata]
MSPALNQDKPKCDIYTEHTGSRNCYGLIFAYSGELDASRSVPVTHHWPRPFRQPQLWPFCLCFTLSNRRVVAGKRGHSFPGGLGEDPLLDKALSPVYSS